MPGGTGRGLAAGLSSGVDNFLNSYLSVKRMQSEEKFKKIQPMLDEVKNIIHDPDTPLNSRISAAKTLPALLGLKDSSAFDEIIKSLEAHSQEQVETTPGTPTEISTGNAQSVGDPNAIDGSLSTPTTPNVSLETKKKIPAQYKTRGQMSANELIQLRQSQQLQTRSDIDFQRQKELLDYQANLAKGNLKATGYNRIVESQATEDGVKVDTDGTKVNYKKGDYLVTGINSAMENKTTNLGTTKSIKEVVANQSKNKPSAVMANLEAGYLNQVNPATGVNYTEEEASAEAAKKFAENYQAGIDYRKLGTTQKTQQTTGNVPIQPAQTADDVRANEQIHLQLQSNLDKANADLISSGRKSRDSTNEAHAFYLNNIKPLENRDDLDDDQIKQLARDRSEYQRLKTIADNAVADHAGNERALKDAQNKLQTHQATSTNSTSGKTVNWSKTKMKTYADKYFSGDQNKAIEYNKNKGVIINIQ